MRSRRERKQGLAGWLASGWYKNRARYVLLLTFCILLAWSGLLMDS